jgi:hypothetical protein
MTNKEVSKIMDVFLENFDDVLAVTVVERITVVTLMSGNTGFAVRKKGDVNKPYNAMKLAYYRAHENKILEKL